MAPRAWTKSTVESKHTHVSETFNASFAADGAVFSWESKSDWFVLLRYMIGLKKLAPLFHPIRSKKKTNRDSFTHVFPRFTPTTCIYFKFWLVHCIVFVLCDRLELLLWSWFYYTQLKTALNDILEAMYTFQKTQTPKKDLELHNLLRLRNPKFYPQLTKNHVFKTHVAWLSREMRNPYCDMIRLVTVYD